MIGGLIGSVNMTWFRDFATVMVVVAIFFVVSIIYAVVHQHSGRRPHKHE